MSSDIYIFIGPTISKEEAQKWLNAHYLPPVSQGDIISLLQHQPKAIGIIDGYFEREPSVWHKEILMALKQGVYVAGASSMGALRAAELYPFGMVGIGQVFTWYRDEIIEAEDEVAVRHAPAEFGYHLSSEAMVNLRYTLAEAQKQGVITPATEQALIAIARQTPYLDRSYARLCHDGAAAALPPSEITALRGFVKENTVDLKRRDAIELLQHLAAWQAQPQPVETSFDLAYTVLLHKMLDQDFSLDLLGDKGLRAAALVNHVRLEHEDFTALRERAVTNTALLQLAGKLAMALSDEELETAVSRFKKERQIESDESFQQWLARNHLTNENFIQLVTDDALVRKVRQWTSRTAQNNAAIIRELRLEDSYADLAELAKRKEDTFAELNPNEVRGLERETLYNFYHTHRNSPNPADSKSQAVKLYQQTGFTDWELFWLELMKYYSYHKKSGS